jgi:hypothetical protein
MEPETDDQLIPTERQQLLQLLWDDIDATKVGTGASVSPTERRQFIRSMFAAIEAAIWLLKQDALEQHGAGRVALSTSEVALLAETAPALQADGTVRDAPAQIRFAPHALFAFKAHARAYGYTCVLDVSDHHWELMRRSARVRNRLMHPKHLASVHVSDDELADARRALRWFAKLSSLASLEAAGWHAQKATEEIEDEQRAAEARRVLREQFILTRRKVEDAIKL